MLTAGSICLRGDLGTGSACKAGNFKGQHEDNPEGGDEDRSSRSRYAWLNQLPIWKSTHAMAMTPTPSQIHHSSLGMPRCDSTTSPTDCPSGSFRAFQRGAANSLIAIALCAYEMGSIQ